MKNKGLPFRQKMYFLNTFFGLIIIFLIFISFCSYAKDKGRLLEYDWGQIPSDKIVNKEYEFKEEIKSAVTSCECLKASIHKKEEPESETLYIVTAEFDPKEYKGEITQDILLLDKNGQLITLRIKAFVQ